MRKVIITGANGFIGSTLTNFLANKGVKVFAIVKDKKSNIYRINHHSNVEIIYCDLNQMEILTELVLDRDIDVFYHLAWRGASGTERADYKVQLNNVYTSLECAKQSKILKCKKFIAIGTIGEYMAELSLENNIVSENYTYAISKKFYHSLLDVFCHKNDIRYIWCTLSGVYGIGDKTSNIINYTIQQLLANKEPEYTKAEQLFDFIYVEDCVRLLYEIGESAVYKKDYYIGGLCPKPLRNFIEIIRDIVSPESKLGFGKKVDDGSIYKKEWFTMDKTLQNINFRHKYSFEQGIKITSEWVKSQKELVNND